MPLTVAASVNSAASEAGQVAFPFTTSASYWRRVSAASGRTVTLPLMTSTCFASGLEAALRVVLPLVTLARMSASSGRFLHSTVFSLTSYWLSRAWARGLVRVMTAFSEMCS